jgi:peptide/nickel transport system substrate-binding protein
MQGQGCAGLAVHAGRRAGHQHPNLKPEAYDLDGAKRLLAEAGYSERLRPDRCLHQRSLYVNDAAMTQAVGQMWSRLGLKITHQHVAEGGVFPARGEAGVQRAAQRQFHRHQ